MRPWLVLLLLFAVATSGCLRELGQDLGFSEQDPDPWVEPALQDATIRPGAALGGGGCTANFLFLDEDRATVYLGTAAHCVSGSSDDSPLSSTNTNGCDTTNQPAAPGTAAVEVEGATRPAIVAYNSWWTMQQNGEQARAACAGNDFALLRLDVDDAARAHPAMWGFGGPTGDAADEAPGDIIHTHGATTARPGPEELNTRQGLILDSSGWTHTTYQLTPGLPGDSGSPVVRDDGQAVGILVTLGASPFPGSNGITDLTRALAYANQEGGMDVTLLTAPVL